MGRRLIAKYAFLLRESEIVSVQGVGRFTTLVSLNISKISWMQRLFHSEITLAIVL